MYESFGAWQVGTDPDFGKAEFKLFFPDRDVDSTQYEASRKDGQNRLVPDFGKPKIESIQVAGTFQPGLGQDPWDFEGAPHLVRQPHPKGWVWTYRTPVELTADFYEYKYYVTFENDEKRKVGDPCARYGGSENQNAAFVIGGSHSEVELLAGERKHQRDLVQYEINISDFTSEFRGRRAMLDAVRDKLRYLQEELGVNAILFMPWTAWPGKDFSWGYNPYLYFSVEYRYANAIDEPAEKLSWLKRLIGACHRRGIQVIMDGVFNHVGDIDLDRSRAIGIANGFPYLWLYQDPNACPYVGTFGGTFSGLKDLDYNNGCTQEFIGDVCTYWIDTFKIDGIRFDNTVNFYIKNDPRGLPQLLQELQDHVTAQGQKNFSLTLEHLQQDAAEITKETAATSYWNDELCQRGFEYLLNQPLDSRIVGALNTHVGLPADKVATTYISNHDHSHINWQAGALSNKGGMEWYRTQPYAIALLTSPGAPLIPNGQEFGEDHWIMNDDQGTNRRVKPRPLRWDYVGDPIGSKLKAVYAKLIELRLAHPGLRSDNFYPDRWEAWQTRFNPAGYGVDTEKGVVIYHRWGNGDDGRLERFIVVLNFSPKDQIVDIPFSVDGEWHDLLNGRSDTVSGFRLTNQQIDSNWGRVYFRRE